MAYELVEQVDREAVFNLSGHEYRFVWLRCTRPEDGYRTHFIKVYKDTEKLDLFGNEAKPILAAVSAFRVEELRQHYKWDHTKPGSVHTFLQDSIAELAERAASGEYIGQVAGEFLYIQLVAQILGWSQSEIRNEVLEMVEAGRISLNGNIIAPKGHTY